MAIFPWLFWIVCYGLSIDSTSSAFTSKTKDDLEVKGLELLEPAFESFDGRMYAGVLPTAHPSVEEGEEGEYMFWLLEPTAPLVDDSLIIWLNGGPGCTSFSAGLFFEMGPVTVPLRPAGSLTGPEEVHTALQYNPHGWHKASSIMYVEQPVNVGFSRGPHEPQNETDIGRAMDGFLQQFVHVFEAYQDKRIFFVGESYAGMYVPSMAYYIHQQNKAGRKGDEYRINLAGIGLGNGWVDATVQGGTVIDYAWWHGMIDSVTRENLHREWQHCILKEGYEPNPFHAYTVPDECGTMGAVAKAAGAGLLPRGLSPNVYDTSTWDPYDLLNSHDSTLSRFFNTKEVQRALNVPSDFDGVWMGCIPGAGRRRLTDPTSDMLRRRSLHLLDQDRPESMHEYMVSMLDDAQISVLVYNGDRDATCNAPGTEMFLDGLEDWSGAGKWKDPLQYSRGLWLPEPEDVQQAIGGYAKEVANLMFVVVYNSGHLVPFNRPVAGLDLISRFLQGKSYVDKAIDPIIVDVTLPNEESDTSPVLDRQMYLFQLAVAMILAFTAGYFASRFRRRKSDGYESVPSLS